MGCPCQDVEQRPRAPRHSRGGFPAGAAAVQSLDRSAGSLKDAAGEGPSLEHGDG